MTVESVKVSVVIPTRNAGTEFEGLLKKVSMQEGDFESEVIVIDSGSTDGTDELARRYGAVVLKILKAEFNHGATRNLGISVARGKYVALIVQDAMPLDECWLAAMVENLERDEQVAGVYSRQIPRKGASVLVRALVNNMTTAGLERREQYASDSKHYNMMSPKKRRRLAVFDNVSSCLRRSVWEEMPFERTNFGEDLRWGKRAVEAGYKTVYEPRSAVFHSHERDAMYDLRRYYVNQRILLELFGLELVPNLMRLFLAVPRFSLQLYRLLHREEGVTGIGLRFVLPVVKYALVTQIGTYLGAKSPSIARLNPRIFAKLNFFLSKGV